MKASAILLAIFLFTCASYAFQNKPTTSQSEDAAVEGVQGAPTASQAKPPDHANNSKANFRPYHAGPWEKEIGYSQAVRVGHTIYVSGTVGDDEKGFPKDMEGQMKLAYGAIRKTMSEFGADFSNVVMERIYTTDMDSLIKCQETRKGIYGTWLPAATWVEVRRLYVPEAAIEIEVELVVD